VRDGRWEGGKYEVGYMKWWSFDVMSMKALFKLPSLCV